MLHPDDLKKFALALLLIATAISAHTLKLPTSWEWCMPYVEFISGAGAIVTTFYMKSPTDRSGK
jgi:hypothetical protein